MKKLVLSNIGGIMNGKASQNHNKQVCFCFRDLIFSEKLFKKFEKNAAFVQIEDISQSESAKMIPETFQTFERQGGANVPWVQNVVKYPVSSNFLSFFLKYSQKYSICKKLQTNRKCIGRICTHLQKTQKSSSSL